MAVTPEAEATKAEADEQRCLGAKSPGAEKAPRRGRAGGGNPVRP